MTIRTGFNSVCPATRLCVQGMVVLGRKSDVHTIFNVRASGFKEGAASLSDEAGKVLFTGLRSWNLVTFATNSDNTVTATRRSYDLYTSAAAGATMSADIRSIPDGTDVCVFTYDEPSGNKTSVADALLTLGASRPLLNAIPFRGSYILIGRKGMNAGQGKELQVSTGGVAARIEFINGVIQP
ncbi:hypothetical protein C6J21_001456 [Salmonella enterica subsp. enterica serovar Thompson]|nr:hypothetical protein [Salmonella enterica]EDR6374183.1 hypothetical protein [Salmonella enterica subsp. enterica serovar Thompson]EAT3714670.1 hypothetical protein [Salmonella enterica]EDU5430270.1 hypothetical protein [Salmonella enterica subsp. enterica serovar Thompson]EFR6439173.1 hypothetical protein [Salmonella enterica]